MNASKRFARFYRTAAIFVLLSLLASSVGCNILHPSKGPDVFVHHPVTFGQREALVTPEQPAVIQALHEALNPPPPATSTVVNGVTYQIPAPPTPTDVGLIINWVNEHCSYTQDIDAHSVSDYWQTPAETIASGKGDCEDYSILLCAMLRAYGAPEDEVYVVVGKDGSGNVHAWVVERYSTGIWLLHDSQPGSSAAGLVLSSSAASSFTTSYCFNDKTGFNGEPVLPAGIFEFESADCSYPFSTGAADSFSGRFNAGQKISARVDWLPYSVEWPFNPLVVEPWSLNIYAENGDIVYTWSGTDLEQTLSYTVTQTGAYRVEVVKRDELARPCRLTLTPDGGWEAANQKPAPRAGKVTKINAIPISIAPPWQDETPRVSAPTNIPGETLVQHALDALNSARATAGLPAIALGTNTAAQAHADDMMVNRFVSDWGTDGSLPGERYTLAGGLGNQTEVRQTIEIDWQGDPALFKSALLSAVEQAIKNTDVYNPTALYSNFTGSGYIPITFDPGRFKVQPDRVNIGIAYDGEKLYLVLQYESFFGTFSQLPVIQNGVLSFAGKCADGLFLYSMMITYRRTPGPLTPAQISYSYGGYGDRTLMEINYNGVWTSAMFISGSSYGFIDPHSIPLSLPPLAQSGFDISRLTNGSSISTRYTRLDDNCLKVNGSEFSFSLSLGELMASSGKGVYSISITAQSPVVEPISLGGGIYIISGPSPSANFYFLANVLTYTFFAN